MFCKPSSTGNKTDWCHLYETQCNLAMFISFCSNSYTRMNIERNSGVIVISLCCLQRLNFEPFSVIVSPPHSMDCDRPVLSCSSAVPAAAHVQSWLCHPGSPLLLCLYTRLHIGPRLFDLPYVRPPQALQAQQAAHELHAMLLAMQAMLFRCLPGASPT